MISRIRFLFSFTEKPLSVKYIDLMLYHHHFNLMCGSLPRLYVLDSECRPTYVLCLCEAVKFAFWMFASIKIILLLMNSEYFSYKCWARKLVFTKDNGFVEARVRTGFHSIYWDYCHFYSWKEMLYLCSVTVSVSTRTCSD